jgi:serine/threonine protein kinase
LARERSLAPWTLQKATTVHEFAMIYDGPPRGDERTVRGAPDDERTVPRVSRKDERPMPHVPDDERTVPGAVDELDAASPLSAQASGPEFAHHPLPYGTLIEGFRITGLIGEGGFGVVYRAWDDALERHVAIKEYMPETLAVRGRTSFDVSVRSERHRGTFEAGLKSFVNEARLLARFDHPALVKVLRFWEGNHTAYMAMPYYEGPTLKTAVDVLSSPPAEETLRDWLLPLLDGLSVLHRQNYYHRDIAPDNILLTASGPLLLDFGAARHVISDMTKTITVVLKPGYAPIEQYGGDTFQGPWTDLYALAGVVRYAITGKTPMPSVERVVNDTMQPLAVSHAGRYSDSFLRAIDAAMAVRPETRVQDVAQFRELLNEGLPVNSPLRFRPSGFQHSSFQPADDREPVLERSPIADLFPSPDRARARLAAQRAEKEKAPARRATARLGKLVYALATAGLLAAGAAVWWVKVREARPPEEAPAPKAAPAPAPKAEAPAKKAADAPASTSARASAPSPAPAKPAASAPVPSVASSPASARPPAASAPAPSSAPLVLPAAPPEPPPAPRAAPEFPAVVRMPPVMAPELAPAVRTAPAPVVVEPPAMPRIVPAPAPAPVPESMPSSRVLPAPRPEPAPARATEAAPSAKSRPAPLVTERARPALPARPVEFERPVAPRMEQAESVATTKERGRPGKCSDIVRKASLEPLDPAEAAYLRKECR